MNNKVRITVPKTPPDPAKKSLGDKPWLCLSNGKYRLRQYFVLYTAMFAIMCCAVFCWYFLEGRTFIWKNDGWTQHYKSLAYYAECIRSVIRELVFNHRFVLPEWGFDLGEGNDILQTLQYYVIGDPFSMFAFLVPARFLWIYYDFMILFRLYLSGAAFSCLCFYTKKNIGRYAVMAGALSYVFCCWAVTNANRHPYFLNPMLYFPLISHAIEQILGGGKEYLLIISVFLAAISNFYYFYNIVLMTVAYVAMRLIGKYKTDLRSMLNALLRISGGSILGTAMGGVILLPVIFAVLNDSRMGTRMAWRLTYPRSYYAKLPGVFFYSEGNYWLYMGYAAPVILAIFLLFMRRKQHGILKSCFLACLLVICVPALGQLFNGMSYVANKWCWAFALVCAYIFSIMWPELMDLKLKDALVLALFLGFVLAWNIYYLGIRRPNYSRALEIAACIGIAFIFLLVVFPFRLEGLGKWALWKRWRQPAAFVLVLIGITFVSAIKNAPFADGYAQEAVYVEDVEKRFMQTEVNAVQTAAAADGQDGFYRYSGRSLSQNAGMLYHLSNTNYFWSISNPAVSAFRTAMDVIELRMFNYRGYDDRTALLTLSSVKYFVVPGYDDAPIPYGFTYVENAAGSNYKVYRNENALPVSYVYDVIISEDRWNELSSAQKQEAMLQSVLLSGYDGETRDDVIDCSSRSLEYSLECNGDRITLEDHRFVVKSKNSSVTLSFEGLANSETYFVIKGLDASKVSTGTELKLESSSGVSKTLNYYTKTHNWYNDRHDFIVNLDYTEDAVTSITVTFSKAGVYSFDSIEVICQPMDRYAEQTAALKKAGLEDVDMGMDTICGKITLDKPQVLCFSIPYSIGWTAYVDGEKARLYQANIKNMALLLDAGDHDVKLVYRTPFLRMGAGLSAIGFIGLIAWIFLSRHKKKKPI